MKQILLAESVASPIDSKVLTLSPSPAFGLSSGDPASELAGDVLGVSRVHGLAFQDPGVGVPWLLVEAIEWVLGRGSGRSWK